MKNEIESVFVIESSGYVEMTYQEFLERRSTDSGLSKNSQAILSSTELFNYSNSKVTAFPEAMERGTSMIR